jgi:ornithine carbamoyltransferase
MNPDLTGRSLRKDTDLDRDELLFLLDFAHELRTLRQAGRQPHRLAGRNIAVIFEKASTRTRSAFEVAAHDEGAHVTYIGPDESHIGYKESIKDTARVLGRMFDGIEYRGATQDAVDTLAANAGVPVWNGLTDTWHPTQALADLLTMRDHATKPIEAVSCCYLGNARDNTSNSLLVAAAILGLDIRICAPPNLQPDDTITKIAHQTADTSGARITITSDIPTGVGGVDFLYTDVWLSMGEPDDAWDRRIRQLRDYQVNAAMIAETGNPAVKFLHCLPAIHNRDTEIGRRLCDSHGLDGLEVTDDVFESPASIVFDQAENRMHTIRAVLIATLGGSA